MAPRPMPKPDPAGRLFPVEPPPASNISQQHSSNKSNHVDKARRIRDYWEIILTILVIAATIFVGWRIAEITLSRSGHSGSKTTSANPLPVNTPTVPQNTLASDHAIPSKPSFALAKPATTRLFNDPVVIQAIVGIDGKVKDAKVLRGNPKLASAALETVRQLSFNPYAPNGTAVEFETEVVVSQSGIHKNANENLHISMPQQATGQQTPVP